MNQQYVTATGRTNSILGCLQRKSVATFWDVTASLFSSLVKVNTREGHAQGAAHPED